MSNNLTISIFIFMLATFIGMKIASGKPIRAPRTRPTMIQL